MFGIQIHSGEGLIFEMSTLESLYSGQVTSSYQLCYIRNKEVNKEIVLFVIFQMEELVDQRNVYSGDDRWFCRYCLLRSTCFDLVGELRPVV